MQSLALVALIGCGPEDGENDDDWRGRNCCSDPRPTVHVDDVTEGEVQGDVIAGLSGDLYLVGAMSAPPGEFNGEVRLLDSSGIAAVREGEVAGQWLGGDIVVADFDKDGLQDAAVGGAGPDVPGVVEVYLGVRDGFLSRMTFEAHTEGTLFGDSVSLLSHDELAVGEPGYLEGTTQGRILVFSTEGLTGDGTVHTPDEATTTVVGVGRVGIVIADGVDLDGDGIPDLAHGSRYAGGGGAVWVTYGPVVSHDVDDSDRVLLGDAGIWGAGMSLDAGEDFDGDGLPDLLVGAPSTQMTPGTLESTVGSVSIVNDETLPLVDAPMLVGEVTSGGAGWAVTSGDFDGDGVPELVASAPDTSGNEGRVYVAEGPFFGVSELCQAGDVVEGRQHDHLGWTVGVIEMNQDSMVWVGAEGRMQEGVYGTVLLLRMP